MKAPWGHRRRATSAICTLPWCRAATSRSSRAAAFTTKLLGTCLCPIGLPVATLLLLIVGNATSGATIGADLLPPPAARAVSALLPPGAAVRAITDLSYFDGSHAAAPVVTLALWAVVAALLLGLRARLTRRRTATAA
ncbi:hypothetical protein AB0N14_26600 [Streptomyces sp. NPDC051104]|uniref:hypothetical protein n=1 Tax=Streptomyces sp. NPDC051104 TaxID=3155044 RepID=UPI0034164DF1